jgi:MiaB-like tRNA modifying enzyme
MNMSKIYASVYGCSANAADYEMALGLLKEVGFEFVDNINESDLNIIFTCVVKLPTANRMIHRIKKLTKTGKPLVVAGCMPKTERDVIERIDPRASMLGPDSIEKVVDVVCNALQGKKAVFIKDLRRPKLCFPKVRRNPIIDIIPISTGCLSNCSYCSVKFARGRLFSYPINMIVKEAEQAIGKGCKELWITSQDNSCYGRDIKTDLPKLLNEIVKIEGNFRTRIGMMNPTFAKVILKDLIKIYKNPKIYKFLHLPVQSGSDKILKLMHREYTVNEFRKIVKDFRKEIKNLTLSTDIIVGFPMEKEGDFEKTIELLKWLKPDIVNLSKFAPRPRTSASRMEQLDNKIIKERSKKLGKLIKKLVLEKNKEWVGEECEVLISERGRKKNQWIGRNESYKPVLIESKRNFTGEFLRVRISDARQTHLIGKIIG